MSLTLFELSLINRPIWVLPLSFAIYLTFLEFSFVVSSILHNQYSITCTLILSMLTMLNPIDPVSLVLEELILISVYTLTMLQLRHWIYLSKVSLNFI
jgi:hypothetical protein